MRGCIQANVAMDLVRDHDDAMALADVIERGQLLERPSMAGGIMRIAQDERLGARLGQILEVLQIQTVAIVFQPELIEQQPAFVAIDHLEVRRIDRSLHDHPVARLGETAENRRHARHDAGTRQQRVQVGRPIVPRGKPGPDDFKMGGITQGVSINAVEGGIDQPIDHGFRSAKVHVGGPQRENVLAFDGRRILVPLIGPFRRSVGFPVVDDVELGEIDRVRRRCRGACEIPFCRIACSCVAFATSRPDRGAAAPVPIVRPARRQ